MSVSEAAQPAVGVSLTGRGRTIATLVVLLAFFMDILDSTIVNVAIPSIRESMEASYSAIQWIIAGYQLAFALILITGGRLGDIVGYKKMFLIGVFGFTVASALSGLATSTEMLIGARFLQGLMAALMVPQILSNIQIMYPTTKERQNISALYGGIAGIATVLGPIIGALLITGNVWDLGWRTIFLVNIPVGIGAMILAWIFLPDAKSERPLKLDLVGVGIVLVAMLMLMFPLIQGRQLDWPAWIIASMIISVPIFVLFAFTQIWKDRHDASPLVVPSLFRRRSFVAGVILSLCFFSVIFGFFFIFTIYLQIGLGYSILKAGLTGIPFSLGVSLAAGMSGPVLVPRFGRKIISAGPLVMGAGYALFLFTIRHYGSDVTPWEFIPALLISGLGMGCVVAPIYSFILAEVPINDAGSASGVVNTTQQIGGAIGIAIVGVVFFGLLGSQAQVSVESVRADLSADLTEIGVPPSQLPKVTTNFEACFVDRSNAKDLAAVPDSCQRGEAALAKNESADPESVNAVRAALQKRGVEANQRNFTRTMEGTLLFQLGALVVIFFLSFALPAKPRTREEMGKLAAEGVIGV
jgi:EmrB/QacA subfamily drug resistance transporter